MIKCDVCKKEYSIDCDYNQGRCPHHPPLLNIRQQPIDMKSMSPVFYDIALEAGGSVYPSVGGRTLEKFGRLVAERCRELADPETAQRITEEFGLDK